MNERLQKNLTRLIILVAITLVVTSAASAFVLGVRREWHRAESVRRYQLELQKHSNRAEE